MADREPMEKNLAEIVGIPLSRVPAGIFLLGCQPDCLPPALVQMDRQEHLGITAAAAMIGSRWVYVPEVWVGRTLVTNGEYREFLRATIPAAGESSRHLFDTADLWMHVWKNLNCQLDTLSWVYPTRDGSGISVPEDFRACRGFVDAYLLSIRNEIEALLSSGGGEGADEEPLAPNPQVRGFLAYVKTRIAPALVRRKGDRPLLAEEEEWLNSCASRDAPALGEELLREIRESLVRIAPAEMRGDLNREDVPIDSLRFIQNAASEVAKAPEEDSPIPFHRLLYPRTWPSWAGDEATAEFLTRRVPWSDLPVRGITLFEALAFATWLESRSHGEAEVSLPSEAEYERAASWPSEELPPEGERVDLDRRKKLVFPWQLATRRQPFHGFFGRADRLLGNHYEANREEWDRLVELTSRTLDSGDTLAMLLGFGYQWTIDRHDGTEQRYNRFDEPDMPRYEAHPCFEGDRSVEVFRYRAPNARRHGLFSTRGCGELIGGVGTTFRRFAHYPLRGYPDVGFRIVARRRRRGSGTRSQNA